MPAHAPRTELATHAVTNQPGELVDVNLYAIDPALRDAVLREAGLYFSDVEFDEMESVLHVKCQTHEQAERFFEFRDWWNFLRHSS